MLKWTCPLALLCLTAILVTPLASDTQPEKTLGEAFPGLATAALTQARLSDLPSGILLRCGEIKFTQKDLDGRLELFAPETRQKVKADPFYILEDAAGEALLQAEAYDWSLKNNVSKAEMAELVAAYLDSCTRNLTVTDAEIQQSYEDNKEDLGGAPLGDVKEEIRKALLDSKRLEAATAHIVDLGRIYDIEVDRAWAAKQYANAMTNPIEKARKSGKPLLVDFGSTGCAPCRRLAPILDEVKKEYAGKLDVLVIDVDSEPVLGSRYGASAIPLQIFYDSTGKERFRHTGFWSKASIVAKLAEIGAK